MGRRTRGEERKKKNRGEGDGWRSFSFFFSKSGDRSSSPLFETKRRPASKGGGADSTMFFFNFPVPFFFVKKKRGNTTEENARSPFFPFLRYKTHTSTTAQPGSPKRALRPLRPHHERRRRRRPLVALRRPRRPRPAEGHGPARLLEPAVPRGADVPEGRGEGAVLDLRDDQLRDSGESGTNVPPTIFEGEEKKVKKSSVVGFSHSLFFLPLPLSSPSLSFSSTSRPTRSATLSATGAISRSCSRTGRRA